MNKYGKPIVFSLGIVLSSLYFLILEGKSLSSMFIYLNLFLAAVFWFGVYNGERIALGKDIFTDSNVNNDDDEDFDIWDLRTLD